VRRRQALVIAIAFAAAACGRFGFGEGGDGPTDGVHIDAGPNDPDAGLGMFATPIAITELDDPSQQDDDPTLTDDMLEVYFDSSRDGGATSGMGDIWVAKRASVADPFGAPTLVAELASTADDTTPDITGDGLRIYWGSDRASLGNRDLYVSTRVDRASPWSVPAIIPELASPGDDSGAIEIDNGRGLIFCSSRAGTQDLYLTTRSAIGQPWSAPVAIPGLSDPTVGESQHWANADGTIVFFSSADIPGSELGDIWVSTRPDSTSAFGPPQRVTEVNSSVDDVDPWLSPDLKTMVFMSYRTGNGDLYVTTR
jgi:hypothetical protein